MKISLPTSSPGIRNEASADVQELRLGQARGTRFAFLMGLSLVASGCGNTLYLVKVNQAEKDFREAQELGAEQHAPYEYYSAKARLQEAKVQAAQAEYGPAAELSDEADDFAIKAVNVAKTKRAGAKQ